MGEKDVREIIEGESDKRRERRRARVGGNGLR